MTDLDLMSDAQMWFMAGASVVAWVWLAVTVAHAGGPRRTRSTYRKR